MRVESATPEDFDAKVLSSDTQLVVVEFWGDDCPNCEVFDRDLPDLMSDLASAPVCLVRINAYKHPEIAERYALFGVPTFLLFRAGRKLGKMSQYQGRAFWLGVIRDHLSAE